MFYYGHRWPYAHAHRVETQFNSNHSFDLCDILDLCELVRHSSSSAATTSPPVCMCEYVSLSTLSLNKKTGLFPSGSFLWARVSFDNFWIVVVTNRKEIYGHMDILLKSTAAQLF